jgi:hypothetical protein
MTQHKDRKTQIRARMAKTGEPYAEAARQLARPPARPPDDPYGYDPDTDTMRVSRHDLARLLLQFREEVAAAARMTAIWGARSPLNEASARTMRAAGMIEEGTIRGHLYTRGA